MSNINNTVTPMGLGTLFETPQNKITLEDIMEHSNSSVSHDITPKDSKSIKKMKKVWQEVGEIPFWSWNEIHNLPPNIPSTAGNRIVNSTKVAKALEKGFDPSLWSKPRVVAIDADLLDEALDMPEYAKWRNHYFIVEQGFLSLKRRGDTEFKRYYVALIDGGHRRLIWISINDIPLLGIGNILDIPVGTPDEPKKYFWECEVSFANISTPEQAIEALHQAHEKMAQMNKHNCSLWTSNEVFFTDVMSQDYDAMKTSFKLKSSGVYVSNGRINVGSLSDNPKRIWTDYKQYEAVLRDPRIGDDSIRRFASNMYYDAVRKVGQFDPNYKVPAIWLHALSLLVSNAPELRKKNGLYNNFMTYLSKRFDLFENTGFVKYFTNAKEIGSGFNSNFNHQYELAIYSYMVKDFNDYLFSLSKGGHQAKRWVMRNLMEGVGLDPRIIPGYSG